jgi:hypothetical protein
MKLAVSTLNACAVLTFAAWSHAAQPEPDSAHSAASDGAGSPASRGLSGTLEVGREMRSLFDIPIRGYELRGALGPADALNRHFWPGAFASVLLGDTDSGLSANHAVVGARFEGRARYLYVGASVGAGIFWLARANGGAMTNFEGLLDLFVGPQIPLGEHAAISIQARYSFEVLPGTDDTVAYGPGLALRGRFY